MTTFQQYLLEWVAENDLPFTSVESPSFRKMVHNLCQGVPIPSADTIKNNTMKTFNKKKIDIRQFLQVINI